MAEKSIPVSRFIARLDGCFDRNDMKAAKECIENWENEARQLGDERGLLTVLNEAVGFYRRTQKKTKALAAMRECLHLAEKLDMADSISGATILINAATTLSFFGMEEEGIALYERAAECYERAGKTETFEYAALLNNKAGTLNALKRYDEAEKDWLEAIDILKRVGGHAGEIAISLVMLAHLYFDRDDKAYDKTEKLLDEAWDYINSDDQKKDGNYAYVLKKCAPSFDYFQRHDEAEAMRAVAKEIYDGNR